MAKNGRNIMMQQAPKRQSQSQANLPLQSDFATIDYGLQNPVGGRYQNRPKD
jgi:hypothetical protein